MEVHLFRRTLLAGLGLLVCAPLAYADMDGRDAVHNETNSVVVNSFNKCVRTKWESTNDECVPPAPPRAEVQRTRVVIGQEERTVYFDFDKTALRPDSQNKLNSLAEKLKSDSQVRQARVFGYADRIGQPDYNDRLSQKRAQVVSNYLVARGFTNTRVTETRWYGESRPSAQCSDGLKRTALIECLQKDRKVEVEIDYLPVQ